MTSIRQRFRPRPLMIVAVAMFFGPALAGLAGVQPKATENRPLRPFPSVTDGWRFLPNLDGWAVDHLPLRNKAVGANERVSERVFGELAANTSGGRAVIKGDGDWLFFRADTQFACRAEAGTDRSLDAVRQLQSLLAARGTAFRFVVPPDKTAIETKHLPASYALRHCAREGDRHFWEQLRRQPPPGYVDAYQLAEQVLHAGGRAYWSTDTHWLPETAARYGQELARQLDPQVAEQTRLTRDGETAKQTDLSHMLGRPTIERAPQWLPRRAGVVVGAATRGRIGSIPFTRYRTTSTSAPLIGGRTVIIGDSYTDVSAEQVVPYYADVTLAHWAELAKDPAAAASLLGDASSVVFEVAQRLLISGRNALLRPGVLQAIRLELDASHG